jgi:hypothetical protein
VSDDTDPAQAGPIERRNQVMERQTFSRMAAIIATIVAASLLAGCAATTRPHPGWGDPETGLILTYRMPGKGPLRYRMTSTFLQSMDMGGQSMETESNSMTTMSFASRGMREDDLLLKVTIDEASVSVVAPVGVMEGDMSEAIGKSFDMTLSPLGEEKDLPDPNSIQYNLGDAGKRSAISSVQMMFPDLPGRPVKVGDSWTTVDGFTEGGGGGEMTISFESVNTLVGFETIDLMDCAVIEADYTGTMKGSGVEGPAKWESEGELEGASKWYFAYKQGILIKDTSELTGTTTVVADTPGGKMTIPTMQDISTETVFLE